MHGLDGLDGNVTAVVLRSLAKEGAHEDLYWSRKKEEE